MMNRFALYPLLFLLLFGSSTLEAQRKLTRELKTYCSSLPDEFADISEKRQADLQELGQYLYEKASQKQEIKLTVICTHNSRRSHLGQLWSMVAAEWFGIDNFRAFSGGTEATAFNPRAVEALNRAGFRIGGIKSTDNPTYEASWHRGSKPTARHLMFSKKYDHRTNPTEAFAAIMVCSEADQSCPVVPGAEARFSLPFDDPRYFDNTASEELEYDKTCRLIARDMFYAMNYAKELLILEAERDKQ
jgi:arsenate reductase (thioredoxin)